MGKWTLSASQPMFTPVSRDDSSARGEFLLFEEAVWWIACNAYQCPAIGPRSYSELILGDESFEDEAAENRGRFVLARDQLLSAVEKGTVPAALIPRIDDANVPSGTKKR
jgi:hypothetical protein